MTVPRTIHLSADDNVVVAVDPIATGVAVAGTTARERVPRGHKMAVAPIAPDAEVRQKGQIIGFASSGIGPGDWLYEHELALSGFDR